MNGAEVLIARKREQRASASVVLQLVPWQHVAHWAVASISSGLDSAHLLMAWLTWLCICPSPLAITLSLLCALLRATDTLRFVAWAVKSPVERSPASGSQRPQHAPHTSCETFVITLKLQQPSSSSTSAAGAGATVVPALQGTSPAQPGGAVSGQLQLAVTDVRLLRVSALPPHLVMANPMQDMLLLGLDPEGAAGAAGQQQEDVMHIDCTKTGAAAAAGSDAGRLHKVWR